MKDKRFSPIGTVAHSYSPSSLLILPLSTVVHPNALGTFAKKSISQARGLATKKVTMMMMTVRRFEWVFIASPPVRCHCATMEWGGYSSHPDPILYMCYSCLAPLANEHFSAQSGVEEGIHTGRYDSRDG